MVTTQRPRRWPSIVAVVLSWALSAGLIYYHHLGLWPTAIGSEPWTVLPLEETSRLLRVSVVCVSLSLSVMIYELVRLGARQRWALDYPFSPWRAIKSVFLAIGWTGVLAGFVNLAVSSALSDVTSAIQSPNWILAAFTLLVGPVCLLVGLAMSVVDRMKSPLSQWGDEVS